MIKEEEKKERVKRQKKLVEIIEMYNIKTSKLSLVTGFSVPQISGFKSGSLDITEANFDKLLDGISKIAKEYDIKPDVEVGEFPYVLNNLRNHGDVMVKKDKVKDVDQYLIDLKMNGFNCSVKTDRDGDYIFVDNNKHKPMVETIVKPKKEIVTDLNEISRVRKEHEDTLKLEPLKEEIVTGDVIEITEDDIKEALEQRSIYVVPETEEEELKKVAEELLEKNGIQDKGDKQSFIEFLKSRFTDEQLKGFVRGMTISSVFEDDIKSAAFYIEYYMNSWLSDQSVKGE